MSVSVDNVSSWTFKVLETFLNRTEKKKKSKDSTGPFLLNAIY